MARIELSNIGGGGGTTLSLTTTGTSGASTLAGSVLNIPIYQGQLTLTTTGTSGAATLVGDTLNIPQYSGGGGTPAGSAGQVQFNSTPAGSFAASANLAWDNTSTQLNIGAPSAPTGKLNVKGSGTLSSTVNLRLTNSGNTELFKVLDNGTTNIGSNFVFNNSNAKLSIGGIAESATIGAVGDLQSSSPGIEILRTGVSSTDAFFRVITTTGAAGIFGPLFTMKSNTISAYGGGFNIDCAVDNSSYGPIAAFTARANNGMVSNRAMFDFCNFAPSGVSTGKTVMRIYASSNISIQDGGTPTNNGYRLDVIGNNATHALRTRAPNTNSGTDALIVQNGTPATLYRVEANGKISYLATNTAAGTTGAQTINQPSGTVNFAAGTTSLVVTNSLCTTASIVLPVIRTNDATAQIKNVVPAAGSFTINLSAAATAETSVGFFIIN